MKTQKEEAEKNGDTFLARIFNRIPEEYIEVVSSKDNEAPKIASLKKFRSLRKPHFDLIVNYQRLARLR